MGDSGPSQEPTSQQLSSFTAALPGYLRTVARETLPYEQQMLGNRAVIAPQQMSLEEGLLGYYGPRYAGIGADIQEQLAMRNAMTEGNVLRGPGTDLVTSAQQLAQYVDPQYYAGRQAAGGKMVDLMGTLNPYGLSGSEREEVARGLNRTNLASGNANTPSQTAAISNALTFGDRYAAKQNQISNILAQTPAQLASFKSGVDVFQQATGRPSYGQNFGQGQYNTQQGQFGSVPVGLAQNLFGEVGQNVRNFQNIDAQKKDWADYLGQVTSSVGNLTSGMSFGM
jgi:hypothetical protein